MTYKETEILISKYLNGETTVEEEKRLALEVMRDDAPEEWRMIGAMLGELTTDEALFDHIMAQRSAQKPKRPIYIIRWAVAASILVLIGFGTLLMFHDSETATSGKPLQMAQVMKDSIKEQTEQKQAKPAEAKPIAETAPAQPMIAQLSEPVAKPSRSVPKAKVAEPVQTTTQPEAETVEDEAEEPAIVPEYPQDYESEPELIQVSSVYQDPNMVNEFIGQFAKACRADSIELGCEPTTDKNAIDAVYVFPDDKKTDVFGRLLQVACWYDNTLPGYKLNMSGRQFYFEMKDLQKNTHYMWIAERIRGSILLHCSRVTLGEPIPSLCWRKFRTKYEEMQYF